MEKVKRCLTRFLWIFIVCIISSSCSEEEDLVNEVVEGLPVSISFELTTPAPNQVTTRATDEQETQVERLMLFFYKDDVSKPICWEVPDVMSCKVAASGTHYTYNISVPEDAGLTSGKWYVYAIANWHKGFWGLENQDISPLKNATKSDLKKIIIGKSNDDIDFTETAMLLTGKYGRLNQEKDDQLVLTRTSENGGVNKLTSPIHLQRSLSKITVAFVNGDGVKFVPVSFDLYNYSKKTTLFERSGWTGIANPGNNLGQLASAEFMDKLDIPIKAGKNPLGNLQYGIQFYMPENIQKAKDNPTSQVLREKKQGEGFIYAPDNSTYIVVHGRYEGPSGITQGMVSANVDYILHLGDFSKENKVGNQRVYNNFSVRRNTKYHFRVQVNGVDNIITEAITTSDEEPQPGAEGDVLNTGKAEPIIFDAHYQTALFEIPVDIAKTSDQFSVLLNTPLTNNNIITKDIQSLRSKDIEWIKFCRPEISKDGKVSYKKYPKDGNGLMNVVDLLEEMSKSENYEANQIFEPVNGIVHIQVFVDEYFYPSLAKENRYNEFVNTNRRVLTLATGTSVSKDGKSTYTEEPIFSFEQRSIKTMYDLTPSKFNDASYNPFGLETEEDLNRSKSRIMYLSKASETAKEEGDAFSGTSLGNGYSNSVGIEDGIVGKSWETFVDFPNNCMQPEYDYGLYHFLLRNRDLNGDGIIQSNEIKWYLPSVNQHIAIWNGYHALPEATLLNKAQNYFTSTNGVYRTLWAYEGAFGFYKPTSPTEQYEAVRCIRSLKSITEETTRSTTFDYAQRKFHVSGFGENAIRPSGSQVGDYPFHPQNNAANKLPQAFEVAREYLGGNESPSTFTFNQIKEGNLCANYSQEPDGKDRGTWRMPNQRELMVMLMIWNDRGESENNFVKNLHVGTAARTYYKDPDKEGDNRVFFVQLNQKLFVTSESKGNASFFKILPVRDVK